MFSSVAKTTEHIIHFFLTLKTSEVEQGGKGGMRGGEKVRKSEGDYLGSLIDCLPPPPAPFLSLFHSLCHPLFLLSLSPSSMCCSQISTTHSSVSVSLQRASPSVLLSLREHVLCCVLEMCCVMCCGVYNVHVCCVNW